MKEDQRVALADALRPRLTHYIPHVPTEKQQLGLILPQRKVLYGGAAGGGKSDWLLMGALQYVDVPGYAALLLRRTFRELSLEGGLIERADEWLGPTDAIWHGGDWHGGAGYTWEFPSGAVLTFGYLEKAHDHLRYQGSNWAYIGFDELTHFRERQYRYLFSRLRRPEVNDETPTARRAIVEGLSQIPLRMRAASNPGGPGHDWVRQEFGIYRPEGSGPDDRRLCHRPEWVADNDCVFLPAKLEDNPHLDRAEYERSLAELDSTTRAQLLDGDWDVREPGEMFRREWFEVVDEPPAGCKWLRYWDRAATEPSESNDNPDWTVGLKMGRHPNGTWYVADVRRFRKRSATVEAEIRQAADLDGTSVPVRMEQEPGASGKAEIEHYQRSVLPRHDVKGIPSSAAKDVRARPVASKAEAGLVKLVRGSWVTAFLDELETFPPGSDEIHDDQVDALSGAFTALGESGAVRTEKYREDPEEKVVVRKGLTLRGERYIDKP